jgi:hypothetical protein
MYTYRKLSGSNTLEGVFDFGYGWSWFSSYWNSIKNRIQELYGLGLKISTYQQKIAVAQQNLLKRGEVQFAAALGDELLKIQDDLDKWWKVKGYLDAWVPTFMKAEQESGQPTGQGLGALPLIILGVAGIVALSAIVNTGLALLQDYEFKSQLTQAVIDQKISTGQMADILSIPKDEGVFEKTVEKVVGTVGIGLGFGIPTVLIVGGGLYLLFTTGMLKGILGGVSGIFGSSSSSTSSSGG